MANEVLNFPQPAEAGSAAVVSRALKAVLTQSGLDPDAGFPGFAAYPILGHEVGVVRPQYPYGDVRRFGAFGDGSLDDTTFIQNALDSVPVGGADVIFPAVSTSYRVNRLIIKRDGTRLLGVGGRVRLRFNGTGANEAPIILIDKAVYNAGENYKDLLIDGFVLDGDDLALYGIQATGFTRRCSVRNVSIENCVCPLRLIDGFFSRWVNVEFGVSPFSSPPGMSGATYAANKYAMYLDVCHTTDFKRCIIFAIGGDSSNAYTAAIRIANSNAVNFDVLSLEEMQLSTHRQDKLILLSGQSTVKIGTVYCELADAVTTLIDVGENAMLDIENFFLNGVSAPSFIRANSRTPIRVGTVDGENVAFSARVFDLASGADFSNVSVDRLALGCGSQTGVIFDAGTTTSAKQGMSCSPILLDNKKASGPTGYITSGYVVSVGATNFIDVTAGTAVINGQSVGFTKHSGLSQRLVPDLTVADTWRVKISPCGTPYIERLGALRAESTFAPTIATFTTAGGGAAPAALTAVSFNTSRVAGNIVDLPKTSAALIHRELVGSRSLTDAGVAAAGALLDLTLTPTAGEDDDITVILTYRVVTTSGSTHSSEVGMVSFVWSKDDGNNYVASTPTKFGSSQARDAGMATLTVTFTATTASQVATLNVTAETSVNSNSIIHFTARILGAGRSGTSVALASGVTVGE